MIKIYHNPRCKKSREGLKYLQDKNIDFEIVDYLKKSFTEKELLDLLMKLHKNAEDIVRTQEAIFKSDFKGKKFENEEWIKILIEFPKLIKRPIVEGKYKAVIAQPPEEIEELL